MEFNTLFFIIFFLPLSVIVYYVTPQKHKTRSMLVISSIYCGFISIYLLAVTYILIILNYYAALYIMKNIRNNIKSRAVFISSVAADTSLLLLLRTKGVMSFIMPEYAQNVFMPVCVSFFMLHFIGYITDVFRRRIFAEKHLDAFALYILFFPKFMMGPVVRYSDFYPYMKRVKINLSVLGKGLMIFIKGLVKNTVIGNALYQLYGSVSAMEISRISALSAWLGIIAFSLSFYLCLSGILDMAGGLSICFGYKFERDFEHPFFASGMGEFFSRWYISIAEWFELYVGNPLKSFKKKYSEIISVIAVWIIMGLWYETSVNKLIWGIITGAAIVLEKIFKRKSIFSYFSILYTIAVTSLGWVFFSQNSISDSLMFLKALLGGNNNIADSLSFYLLKSYIVILLIAVYISSDLFKNLLERIKDKKYFSVPYNILMPAADIIFLVLSISAITSGDTESSIAVMFGKG